MKASESFTLPTNVEAPAYSTPGAALRAIAVTTAKAALDRVIGASSAPGTVPCPTEREGFEPSNEVAPVTRLAGECLQPLGHLSQQRSIVCTAWRSWPWPLSSSC